jgi:hypothetical protein
VQAVGEVQAASLESVWAIDMRGRSAVEIPLPAKDRRIAAVGTDESRRVSGPVLVFPPGDKPAEAALRALLQPAIEVAVATAPPLPGPSGQVLLEFRPARQAQGAGPSQQIQATAFPASGAPRFKGIDLTVTDGIAKAPDDEEGLILPGSWPVAYGGVPVEVIVFDAKCGGGRNEPVEVAFRYGASAPSPLTAQVYAGYAATGSSRMHTLTGIAALPAGTLGPATHRGTIADRESAGKVVVNGVDGQGNPNASQAECGIAPLPLHPAAVGARALQNNPDVEQTPGCVPVEVIGVTCPGNVIEVTVNPPPDSTWVDVVHVGVDGDGNTYQELEVLGVAQGQRRVSTQRRANGPVSALSHDATCAITGRKTCVGTQPMEQSKLDGVLDRTTALITSSRAGLAADAEEFDPQQAVQGGCVPVEVIGLAFHGRDRTAVTFKFVGGVPLNPALASVWVVDHSKIPLVRTEYSILNVRRLAVGNPTADDLYSGVLGMSRDGAHISVYGTMQGGDACVANPENIRSGP